MLDDQSNSDLIDLNWDHLDPFEQFRTRLFLLQSAFSKMHIVCLCEKINVCPKWSTFGDDILSENMGVVL